MPVTKSMRECYEVRERHEWANITLHCWDRPANVGTKYERTYYCGEITIQSSFGTWGYVWTACGRPFKEFLIDAEFDYVFTKFMGADLEQFDGDKSMRELRREALERRKRGEFSKVEARALWDMLGDCEDEATSSSDDWVNALGQAASYLEDDGHLAASRYLSEPWEAIYRSPKPGPVGFWRELWPSFIGALKTETAPAMQVA